MRLLLDTHVFLWFIGANPKLPLPFRTALQDPANELFLSVASVWEAIIKTQVGKLPLPTPPATYLCRQRSIHGIVSLPVDENAMSFLSALPPIHRDPFDRIIVAQALQHRLTIVTVDPLVWAYPVQVLPSS